MTHRSRSLRRTMLVGALIGIFLPTLLFVGYEFGVRFPAESERSVQEIEARYSQVLTRAMTLSIWTGDLHYANEIADAVMRDPNVARIRVTDEFGDEIVDRRAGRPDGTTQRSRTIPLVHAGHTVGSLTLEVLAHQIRSNLYGKLQGQLVLIVGQLLLSLVIILLVMEHRVLRPLLVLKGAAGRIARGEFEGPLHSPRRDEIGDLTRSLDRMRADLKALLAARDLAARELGHSERRFRILSSITNDVVFTCRRHAVGGWRVDWLSGDAERIFGCPGERVVEAGDWLHLVCPPQRPALEAALRQLQEGQSLALETALDGLDGARRNVRLRAKLEPAEADGAAPRLHGALEDITERKRAEEARRLADAVYQNSGQSIVITDAQLHIVAVNPAFSVLSGFGLDDVKDQPLEVLFAERLKPQMLENLHEALRAAGRWEGETWHRRLAGQDIACWLSVDTVPRDDGEIDHYVVIFHDITEKKRTESLVWQQANYDSLTGLPNRRLFGDRLEQDLKLARRNGTLLAVLFIDLDRFKEVNDVFGHHRGDELLVEAAQRISACVRDSDTVARIGGDEFTLALPNLQRSLDVESTARAILEALARPFPIGNESVFVSASIGITLFPDDGQSMVDLLKNADQAMYEAKRSGRNRFSYYMSAMEESSQLRMQLTNALHRALQQEEFQLAYQPIVELASGRVCKTEALVRWLHPEHGVISPDAFIPLAEETGVIHALGDWVFRQALADAARFRAASGEPIQIGINLSPVQLRHPDRRCLQWTEALAASVPASDVIIEITEGVLLDAEDFVVDQLSQLKASGMQFAIDDFGTGYSSLSYLKKFAIDYVKIDRSFTAQLAPDSDELALCEAIVVMAHKLGLKVIAEGIETPAQRDLLIAIGCDLGQGYLFARPMPADALIDRLRSGGEGGVADTLHGPAEDGP
ncbi:MAG: EAL domain-containing protein [Rhodocyclaceae bacterium]|nr:EAL domain-containing protein [Rhodocyclaceae bacterium]